MNYDGIDALIISKYVALQEIVKANATKKFVFPRWLLIGVVALVLLALVLPMLLVVIAPLLLLATIGVVAVFLFRALGLGGKSPERRIAEKQIVLLKKAVEMTMVQRGIGEDRAKEILKDFPKGFWGTQEYADKFKYDEQVDGNFTELCRQAGITRGGILRNVDSRML